MGHVTETGPTARRPVRRARPGGRGPILTFPQFSP